jgi:hypothetical protein
MPTHEKLFYVVTTCAEPNWAEHFPAAPARPASDLSAALHRATLHTRDPNACGHDAFFKPPGNIMGALTLDALQPAAAAKDQRFMPTVAAARDFPACQSHADLWKDNEPRDFPRSSFQFAQRTLPSNGLLNPSSSRRAACRRTAPVIATGTATPGVPDRSETLSKAIVASQPGRPRPAARAVDGIAGQSAATAAPVALDAASPEEDHFEGSTAGQPMLDEDSTVPSARRFSGARDIEPPLLGARGTRIKATTVMLQQ